MFSWVTALFSSLGSSSQQVTLILMPDEKAKKYAGFHSGEPLKLTGTVGETVGQLMDRFNTYRGPNEQITELWQLNGDVLPFSTVLMEERRVWVSGK